jgi:hypothetical protein
MIYLLLVLFFLLASLLVFPIGVELDYSARGRRWYVVWLWLHIPVPEFAQRMLQSKRKKGEGKQRARKDAEETKERRAYGQTISDVVEGMRGGVQMFESGLQTLRSVTHHVRIRVHRLNVILATPNPALTGISYGMMCAFGGALALSWPIVIEPDFTRTTSEVSFRVEARITVIKIMPAAWKFLRTSRGRRRQRT